MRYEAVIDIDDLHRDRWQFSLDASPSGCLIHFDYYTHETRATKRHNWKPVGHYARLDMRSNSISIDKPEIPDTIIRSMREYYKSAIDTLEIK